MIVILKIIVILKTIAVTLLININWEAIENIDQLTQIIFKATVLIITILKIIMVLPILETIIMIIIILKITVIIIVEETIKKIEQLALWRFPSIICGMLLLLLQGVGVVAK